VQGVRVSSGVPARARTAGLENYLKCWRTSASSERKWRSGRLLREIPAALVTGFDSAERRRRPPARRFKNLPDRHFRSLEALVRQHFK